MWGPDPYPVPDRRLTDRQPWINGTADGRTYDWVPVRRYSTDWSAMKRIIEAMYRHSWRLHLCSSVSTRDQPYNRLVYYADFTRIDSLDCNSLPEYGMHGEDGPLVVVRAAVWRMQESVGSAL